MWALRFLTGPQAGKVFPLKVGRNILGRSQQADVQVLSMGASKDHCEITIQGDKMMIKDLQSRNGTLLNGVRIQSQSLRQGDKIGIHDVIMELISGVPARPSVQAGIPNFPPSYQGSAAPQYQFPQYQNIGSAPNAQPQAMASQNYMTSQGFFKGLVSNINDYLERVALPGVYRLPTLAEFKFVLAGFLGVVIFIVTALCMIPAMQVSKASILIESKRRAQSLARSLAQLNQTQLLQGAFASVGTYSIESEDGVKEAFIIQQVDGAIVAPASRQGRVADLPFVHSARRENKPQVRELDGSTIGASFPIGVYDPATGEPNVKYHAVIIYDVGSLAIDDGRAISLFMQSLLLACIFGLFIYYFMYKMIEHPFASLNSQLDVALREKKDDLRTDYIFPALQNLTSNINSLLSRYLNGESGPSTGPVSHADEAGQVVDLISDPSFVISAEGRLLSLNSAFENLVHTTKSQVQGQNFQSLPDVALQQNIEFLIGKTRENPYSLYSDQLEIGGRMLKLNCRAFGQPTDYYVFTISKSEDVV